MRTAEIAKRYLDYFGKNGHMVVPSASLISPNPTTLFTIAGMVPFIPYLLGEQTPPSRRMASNQKCVRTLDIDEVGKTTRHGTFFQMVGNFSFGDYFKEEAIHYAWELLTTPQDKGGYGFDPEKLWVTTYTDDDEARAIWKNEGFDPEHMQVFGMEDNFWTTGGPGPGGPCSEIYVDRGPKYGKDGGPAADESRFIEIWDLVFENFQVDNVKSKTDLHIVGELDQKNIDTGAGLERLAYLMQGKENIYETDEVYPVIEAAEKLSGVKYGDNNDADVRFRVVADHVRSALMIMSDGVRPSNVGRGYVLRRLLRRTVRAMRMLGVQDPVLPTLFPVSKAAMEPSYPELNNTFHEVSEAAYGEEDAFRRTLEKGTTILDLAVEKAKKEHKDDPIVGGSDAFTLHDTYGFPIELTLEMAAEQGVKVDEAKFRELMSEQKGRARADALKKRHNVDVSVYDDIKKELEKPIDFLGYTDFSSRSNVLAIVEAGKGSVKSVTAPANVEIILDRTPFYAERGGQIADQGEIISDDGAILEVDDVQRPIGDGWSRELCGGTHAKSTGKIGMVTILSESSIGSGVRRIDALCGEAAYEYGAREHTLVAQLADMVNARPDELAERLESLLNKMKDSDRKLAAVYEAQLNESVPALVDEAKNSSEKVKLVLKNVGNFGSFDALRKTALDIRARLGESAPVVVVLAGVNEDDRPMVAVATNEAARGLGAKAGDLVRTASKVLGGGGGGKPDFAQGGGVDASKIDEALESVKAEVANL